MRIDAFVLVASAVGALAYVPSAPWVRFTGAPIKVHSGRGARRSSTALQMKIQWDPYTGQFIDDGQDAPEEVGVAPRAPSPPTGTKVGLGEIKGAAGSFGKAAAYAASRLKDAVEEAAPPPVDNFIEEIERITREALGPGDQETWPQLSDNMKGVLRNEQEAALETVRRNLDASKASVLLVLAKEGGPLPQAVERGLRARGAGVRAVVGAKLDAAALEGTDAILILPSGEAKGPFGGADAVLDSHEVEALLSNAAEAGGLRHVVFVSSLGTEKAGFQFNFDGSLEKKKAVEQSIRRLSKTLGFNFTIMRVGPLTGAKAGEEGLVLEPGDSLSGSTCVPLAAEAVLQTLGLPSALNASFSIVSAKGAAPSEEVWRDEMVKNVGPEVLRIPLKHADPRDARTILRAWALQFMEGSRKLTTPVFAVRSPLGVKIYFLPTMRKLGPSFAEEKAIERARMKGEATPAAPKSTRPILEGGIEVCVDESPVPRVRARRIAMEEGTVVKAMSERDLLASLSEEVQNIEKEAAAGTRPKLGGA